MIDCSGKTNLFPCTLDVEILKHNTDEELAMEICGTEEIKKCIARITQIILMFWLVSLLQ